MMASASARTRRASASPGSPCSGTRPSNRVVTNDSTRRARLPRPSARSALQPVANRAGVNRVSEASGAFAVGQPAPPVGRQFVQCVVEEDAAATAWGEFPLAPGKPGEALDAVHQTDVGAGSHNRRWKGQRVECNVVLAKKLHEPRSRSGSPPHSPVSPGRGRRPFLRQRHIRDRCVEPDIEYLAIPAGLQAPEHPMRDRA